MRRETSIGDGGVILGFIFNNASLSARAGGNRWGFLSGALAPCLYFGKNRNSWESPAGPLINEH